MQVDKFPIDPFPSLEAFRPSSSNHGHSLNICIVTEEIFGPVRNGGIASTYYALARMMVEDGHQVTVLYTKGTRCENETIEHWIEYYASLGVTFVPLPTEPIVASVPRWQGRFYGVYRWLKARQPFDVVHASEWRGTAYYALLAKRQGIAFSDTIFLMKASSPHIWNRHYQMLFLTNQNLLGCMYPEQASIELADVAIGGSAHLLRFMQHVGYTLPERSFVQPNVVSLDIKSHDAEDRKIGSRIHSKKLTFFGRLEARKGLEIFCVAIDYLVARGVDIEEITFLGKEAGNLPAHPDKPNKEYVAGHAKDWPFPVTMHDDFDQDKALEHLLAEKRIAIMPSLIENSTMAVYEALVYNIPFIASRSGGTPELIAPEYHDDVLVDANPHDLADGIERVLTNGALIAQCSFDNDENLAVWRQFHHYLAETIAAKGAQGALHSIGSDGQVDDNKQVASGGDPENQSISLCIYHPGTRLELAGYLDELLSTLEDKPTQILVALNDPGRHGKQNEQPAGLDTNTLGVPLVIVSTDESSLGGAFNEIADQATSDACIFMRSDIHHARPSLLSTMRRALASSPAAGFGPAYDIQFKDVSSRYLPMGGDIALGSLDRRSLSGGVIAVRTDAFRVLNGFLDTYGIAGIEHDLAMRLLTTGAGFEACPEALFVESPGDSRLHLNEASAQRVANNTLVDSSPSHLKRIFLSLGNLNEEAGWFSQHSDILKDGSTRRARALHGAAQVTGTQTANRQGPVFESHNPQNLIDDIAWQLVGLRDRTYYGWVYSTEIPEKPIELDVFFGSEHLGKVATQALSPAQRDRFPADVANYAFAIDLPMHQLRNNETTEISFHCSDHRFSLYDRVTRAVGTAGRSRFIGACENNSEGVLRGWALDASQQRRPLEMSIFVDGRFLRRTPAIEKRLDLAKAKKVRVLTHGFKIPLNSENIPRNGCQIEVCYSETGQQIKGSPIHAKGNVLKRSQDDRTWLADSLSGAADWAQKHLDKLLK